MKFIVTSLLSFLVFTGVASAQLFEDFESPTFSSYALTPTVVDLESGPWVFHQALLGQDDRDRKNGEQALRLRVNSGVNGSATMDFDKPNGAGQLSFLYANSDFFGDGDGKLQVQYSTNQGESWSDVGPELEATNSLQSAQISVNQAGDIRFRILHTAGNRINVDDFQVADFSEEPTIAVLRGTTQLVNNSTLNLGLASLGSVKVQELFIQNLGSENLQVDNITISGEGYQLIVDTFGGPITSGDSRLFEVEFIPQQLGVSEGQITITSNANNHPEFILNVETEGFERNVISIGEARSKPLGSRVSVGGWITALDEFNGPVFFQDYSGAMAWYDPNLMPANGNFMFNASHGDSIVVSGTLIEVDGIQGQPGTGLFKISRVGYEVLVYPNANKIVEPMPLSGRQLLQGDYSGRLVRINGANFNASGVFQDGNLYTFTDRTTTSGRFRVNGQTDLSGTQIPAGQNGLTGIVFKSAGNQELVARGTFDIDENAYVYPGDDIPQDQTLDVVTWNIEWFGSSSNGPSNVQQQVDNVKTVIENLNADVYAFQEIANNQVFNQLVAQLEGYSGLIANYSQTQKTAYIYKTSVIDVLNFGLLTTGQNSNDWAGRLPFWLFFNASIGEENVEVHAYNIHAKAFSDASSYNQRVNSSISMKSFLDTNRPDANVLFLGDYNDFVTSSTIGGGNPSPYKNFQDDPNYYILSTTLETSGFASWRFTSMIDHITVTNDLIESHIEGAQRVDDTSTYITNYLNTTSDHFPVLTRFYFGNATSLDEDENDIPQVVSLSQNYPNPFNPSTNIQFELTQNEQVTLTVYDITGRRVATLLNSDFRSAGVHTVTFNAGSLASGMYLYRLSLGNGTSLTNKMMLIK